MLQRRNNLLGIIDRQGRLGHKAKFFRGRILQVLQRLQRFRSSISDLGRPRRSDPGVPSTSGWPSCPIKTVSNPSLAALDTSR